MVGPVVGKDCPEKRVLMSVLFDARVTYIHNGKPSQEACILLGVVIVNSLMNRIILFSAKLL